MSSKFTSVVFDFGGVLITPITNLLDEIAGWHGIEMVEMLDVLIGPREQSTGDHPWHRAERGELPLSVLQAEVAPFADSAGLALRGDEYERLLCGEFVVHNEVLDKIAELGRRGYKTGLLTNSFREFRPLLESKVDFGLFDVVIDSSEVGLRKPDREIYDLTAQRLGTRGDQIVYLDDFSANLAGAEQAGWTTIHVIDPAVALRQLESVLGSPSDHSSIQ